MTSSKTDLGEKEDGMIRNRVASASSSREPTFIEDVVEYRQYKRRYAGLVGMFVLSFAGGMNWPYFGPIANNMSADFGITLDQVNWLGTILACIYLPVAPLVPIVSQKFGLRRCCDIGAVALLISAWIRYSGTVDGLSSQQSYGLLILGQFFAAIAQPIFQVLAPKYSELWFDLKGRTTATMIISVANPIGGAIGQIISPLVGSSRQSILVLGIISTVAVPFVFLIGAAPPIPPTYSGSKQSAPFFTLLRALVGREKDPNEHLKPRERLDFFIVAIIFGMGIAEANGWSVLSAQVVSPVGYSADEAGFLGATLLLSGIVAAIITAPLTDRIFTQHLALIAKICVPPMSLSWFGLIWAVRPHNDGALYALMAIIGVCSIILLPIGQELACEVTRNAEGSSALLWFSGNLFGVILILVEGALREGPEASPPLNMRHALIFGGVLSLVCGVLIFFLRGEQARKNLDRQMQEESRNPAR